MNYKSIFLLLCVLTTVNICTAQYSIPAVTADSSFVDGTRKTFSLSGLRFDPAINVVPANFYTNNFGFFCKQEWKLEKITAIPLKFRIGSVQQVDLMEGKPNTLLMPVH